MLRQDRIRAGQAGRWDLRFYGPIFSAYFGRQERQKRTGVFTNGFESRPRHHYSCGFATGRSPETFGLNCDFEPISAGDFAVEAILASGGIPVRNNQGGKNRVPTMIYTHVVEEELEGALKSFRGAKVG